MITPTPLMGIVTGYWAFKTLAAAVELDLFGRLAGARVITRAEAEQEFGLPERPADLFLAACASLGLLEKAGDGYRNTELAEQFLVPGRPHYFGGQVRYCDERTYLPWHRITEALRSDKPLTWDPATQESLFTDVDEKMLALFWAAMYSTSSFTARSLGEAYDFGGHRRLLDVGGGAGAFPVALCGRFPELTATIFDLPHVCAIAETKIASAGLTDRIGTTAGNFLTDPALPTGHDVILLSMILHDWDEAQNRSILAKCHAALPPGGTVVISELLLNDERTGPPAAALMGLNMLVETEGGRNYSAAEYGTWLTDAGFTDVRTVTFDGPGANGAVLATRA
ncbi:MULTISPECIES: methyltransferase [Micromonospora]|uniref:Dimerisation domain-containing protein n=1 Tax=Micromonospora yangpuensis TaxID=683228 RepID=A0A1C6VCS7_9ACTN|nr:methyltransferase [Micromonospora yangpuensis]GGM12306.1 methyltransferase/methylase [Micromonospora yangpuensis]SCL63630.1 Dimerisation domain-containing protein [Micromonospora yangpuensis]